LGYLDHTENIRLVIVSEGPEISQQGTAGNRKHVTLTIPQKREIIWRLEYGGSQREIMASYST
jgi:hypothetical protein